MDWIDDTIMSRKEAARWYDVEEYVDSHGTSYNGIHNFCLDRGMRLCTFEEYCPNGQYGDLFVDIPWYQVNNLIINLILFSK